MKTNTLRVFGVLLLTTLLLGFTNRDGAYNLDNVRAVATADIGGQTYLFVSAALSDTVSVFRVTDDGRLSFVDDVRDGERGANNLDTPSDLATADISGQTYLFVSAWDDSAVSVFSVANDGRLSFVDSVEDLERGARNLPGANSVATAIIGAQAYLFVGADRNSDDIKNKAVSVFSVADDGSLSFVEDISDGELGAENVEVATAVIAEQTYLFVSVSSDGAVSVFSVDNGGSLIYADYIEDGERRANNLDGAWSVATMDMGDQTYLFVSALADNAVSVFSVTDDGRSRFVDDVRNGGGGANNLNGVSEVATAVIDGQSYLFVSAYRDDAVSVFRVADDGRLSFVDDVQDGERGANNLDESDDIATAVIGGQTYLFVAAYEDDAVSVFRVADDGSLTFIDDVKHGEPIL